MTYQQEQSAASTPIKVTRDENMILEHQLFDCPLCQELLMDPITTSCGHTFCKGCILRAMDHDNKCPLCRNVIHVSPEYGISILLQQIIQTSFPQQYKLRREELRQDLKEQSFNLPLFLLGELTLFPFMALPLHVFEPRYRLLIRRCLEGGKRFGIVPSFGNQLCAIGTSAIIDNHYLFPDGRSLVATTGGERFKVYETSEIDGYKVGKVEYIHDNPIPLERRTIIEAKYNKAKELVTTQYQSVLTQIEQKFGKMPSSDVTRFSWWLSSIVPGNAQTKYKLLETQSVEVRVDELINILMNINSNST